MRTPIKGFTLIELLVVIAIIGLLAAVILASLAQARTKASDSKRIQQMEQLTRALELYAADNNGDFPNPASNPYGTTSSCSGGGASAKTCVSALTGDLVPKYINELPVDPVYGDTSNGFRYKRCNTNNTYAIVMRHESGTDPGGVCNVRTTAQGVYTSGNDCWLTSLGTPSYGWCADEL